jgi:trehalose 6-phosphate synthase/phosphatase
LKKEFNRLVISSNRLPFKFIKTKTGIKAVQNSGGLVSAILALSENLKKSNNFSNNGKIVWAGTADNIPENFPKEKLENEYFELLPVGIPSKINELSYGGFCNDLIWPLFHYFPSYNVFNSEYYKAYEESNKLFFQ